jgi:hypothetical protein
VANAVRRFYEARQSDNAQKIQFMRHSAGPLLVIAIVFVLVVALLIYALLGSYLAHAGLLGQLVVLGSFSVFAWVILWDTLEALIIDPIPTMLENRALRRLVVAEVIVDTIPAT